MPRARPRHAWPVAPARVASLTARSPETCETVVPGGDTLAVAGETSLRGEAGGVVAALCLIQFVDVLGVTVVVTALPRMLADLGGTSADGTLVATLLLAGAGVLTAAFVVT